MRLIGMGRCPYCSSDEIHRSSPRNIWDRLALVALLRPVRCHGCMRRHFIPILFRTKSYAVRTKPVQPVGDPAGVEDKKSA